MSGWAAMQYTSLLPSPFTFRFRLPRAPQMGRASCFLSREMPCLFRLDTRASTSRCAHLLFVSTAAATASTSFEGAEGP